MCCLFQRSLYVWADIFCILEPQINGHPRWAQQTFLQGGFVQSWFDYTRSAEHALLAFQVQDSPAITRACGQSAWFVAVNVAT